MPRTYKRKLGSRSYSNYSVETLEKALLDIVEGKMTVHNVSKHYNIPYGTLYNKYTGRHIHSPGGQTALTSKQEENIIFGIKVCGDWGYPLESTDLKVWVKLMLESEGKKDNNRVETSSFHALFGKIYFLFLFRSNC